MKRDSNSIERLQENLSTIRSVAGLSADQLAEMLDVSRQTIVNLESQLRGRMTTIQYLALRSVFDEIAYINHNTILKEIIKILVDTESVYEQQKAEIRNYVLRAVKAKGRRAGAAEIGREAVKYLEEYLRTTKPSNISKNILDHGKSRINEILNSNSSNKL